MTSTSQDPGHSLDPFRELDFLEMIAKQGLEISSLRRQLCLAQLEKVHKDRQVLQAKIEAEYAEKCSSIIKSQTPDRKAS
jgi:hypothetical protein